MVGKGEYIHIVRKLYTLADFSYVEVVSREVRLVIERCLFVLHLVSKHSINESTTLLKKREEKKTHNRPNGNQTLGKCSSGRDQHARDDLTEVHFCGCRM